MSGEHHLKVSDWDRSKTKAKVYGFGGSNIEIIGTRHVMMMVNDRVCEVNRFK